MEPNNLSICCFWLLFALRLAWGRVSVRIVQFTIRVLLSGKLLFIFDIYLQTKGFHIYSLEFYFYSAITLYFFLWKVSNLFLYIFYFNKINIISIYNCSWMLSIDSRSSVESLIWMNCFIVYLLQLSYKSQTNWTLH